MTEMQAKSLADTIAHIKAVQGFLSDIIAALDLRLSAHDESKLREPELSGYAGLSEALKGLAYGTPEHRAAFAPFKPIIKHHYLHNDHHPEHFQNGINDMDLLQIIEMLADWKAASTRHSASLTETIGTTIERFGISEQFALIIRNTIDAMGW